MQPMNPKFILSTAAGAVFLGAGAVSSAFAGAVLPNSSSCASYSSFSVNASGDLSITCSGTTTAPVNTAPVNTAPVNTAPVNTAPVTGLACGNFNMSDVDWDQAGVLTYRGAMSTGQGFVFKFTTGASGSRGSVAMSEADGASVTRTMVLSTQRCDFALRENFATIAIGSPSLSFSVGYNAGWGTAQLTPNTTYYVNMRNTDEYYAPGVDTCPGGQRCNFNMSINKF